MNKTGYEITCSEKEISKIRIIARSRTAGIWRMKRAKIILGHLEGKPIDSLVLENKTRQDNPGRSGRQK